MSFNSQSLHAKFSEFSELINLLNSKNCAPDVICVQELWQISPYFITTLPGYHPMIFKLRNCTQGGGVGIHVKNHLNFKILPDFSIFVDRILGTIFIKTTLPNNTKYSVGYMNRPGTTHPALTPLDLFN